jgi:cyclic beta-1,2-glucan synthetase
MLEWLTPPTPERRTRNCILHACGDVAVPAVSLALSFSRYVYAVAVAGIWFLSPLLVVWLGREAKKPEGLDAEDKLMLARFAGGIWRYFDELLTPEDHWLPPDNFQEQPSVGTAHRTSPTNIGLALLSALRPWP